MSHQKGWSSFTSAHPVWKRILDSCGCVGVFHTTTDSWKKEGREKFTLRRVRLEASFRNVNPMSVKCLQPRTLMVVRL